MKKESVKTVGKRLGFSYATMMLLIIGSGVMGLNSTRILTDSLGFITHQAWNAADGAMEGVIQTQKQVLILKQVIIEPSMYSQLRPSLLEANAEADKAFARMLASGMFSEDTQKRLAYYRGELDKVKKDMARIYGSGRSLTEDDTWEVREALEVKVDDLLGFLGELEAVADGKIEGEMDEISNVEFIAYVSVAVMLALGMLGAFGFYFSNRRQIVLPLRRAAQMMEDIAQGEGNLTVALEVKGKDEIAQLSGAFNHFVAKLRDTMLRVTAATAQLATATEEMSAIAQESQQGISRQRSETDMVATSMNEMSATTQEVARNAAQASESAVEANDHAQNGEKVVGLTISAIERLAREVGHATTAISTLNEDSANIAGVLDVIKGIAEQTNLLALNAAIEAARAGEQGRGFAVVADEVRTLASRTRESTEEIENMIQRLLDATGNAVNTMQSGQAAAQDAVATSDTARKALKDITGSVNSIVGLNNQIATAAEQQGVMAEEVSRSITNINNIAIETDAGAVQANSSSQEMARLATELQGLVQQFRV